jgi:hypothetical protein
VSLGDVIALAKALDDDDDRKRLLLELAKSEPLDRPTALEVLAARASLRWSSEQRELIEALVARDLFPLDAAIDAASKLDDQDDRRALLVSFAHHDGLAGPTVLRLTDACASLRWSSQRREVLETLLERGLLPPAIAVGRAKGLDDEDDRRKLLGEIAHARGLARADAARLVEEGLPSLRWSSQRAELLAVLSERGLVGCEQSLAVAEKLDDDDDRKKVLVGLASRSGVDAADAARIAAAARLLRWDSARAEVLVPLVESGALAVEPAVAAALAIGDEEERGKVLIALASRAELDVADADRIAAAAASLGNCDARVQIILALIGRASRAVLEATARGIPVESERRRVLDRIAGKEETTKRERRRSRAR